MKEPLRVWGCIVPWNYPLLLLAWKLAPAVAAGNAVVAKPSELTPVSTLMLGPGADGARDLGLDPLALRRRHHWPHRPS